MTLPCADKSPLTMSEARAADAALLERVRSGDEAASEELVRSNGGRMLAVARRFLRCEQDAADAVQEAFLSAFRSLPSFAGDACMATWLHRIVVNVCLMKLRSDKGRMSASIEHLMPTFDETGHHIHPVTAWAAPPAHLMTQELRTQVRQRIDQLPDTYRLVLLLRDIEELDTAETADRLNISQTTVKVRLHRARQALRCLLEPVLSGAK